MNAATRPATDAPAYSSRELAQTLPDAAPVLMAGDELEAGGGVDVLPEPEPVPDPLELPPELVLLELEPELELPGAELEVALAARAANAWMVLEPF